MLQVSNVHKSFAGEVILDGVSFTINRGERAGLIGPCLLYTSDAADERSSVDLGGRRIIKKKNTRKTTLNGSVLITLYH